MTILYDERVDGELPRVPKQQVLQALARDVPGLTVLHTEEDLRPYECDGLSAYRTTPMLVVLPEQLVQVRPSSRFAMRWVCRWWPAARAQACRVARCHWSRACCW